MTATNNEALHQMTAGETIYCQRCDQLLNNKRVVWLNLNCVTGKFSTEEPADEAEDQGWFPFGVACSKRQLKEDR